MEKSLPHKLPHIFVKISHPRKKTFSALLEMTEKGSWEWGFFCGLKRVQNLKVFTNSASILYQVIQDFRTIFLELPKMASGGGALYDFQETFLILLRMFFSSQNVCDINAKFNKLVIIFFYTKFY